jgi:hydroxyethylthiazole kinase-like uncharacterized protein yjeF
MKVVSVEEMRRLEARSVAAGVSLDSLMEAAGLAVARRITQMLDGVRGKRAMVLVGPGNNGGDGMVAARYLSDWGALVTLYMTSPRRRQDKFEECRTRRVRVVEAEEDVDQWALSSYLSLTDVVLDAVLGIGQDRGLDGTLRDLFAKLSEAKEHHAGLTLVALDVPTGVNADTGEADGVCPQMDMTITLGAPKVGLLRFPAAGRTGQLETADIGLPEGVDSDISLEMSDDALVAPLLPARPLDSHKGTYGRLVVVAGSSHFIGAPVLTCVGAYRTGAGLVTLAAPASVYRMAAPQMPETTHLPLAETPDGAVAPAGAMAVREALLGADAAVLGPGLGQSEAVQEFIQQTLLSEPPISAPLVLDADALNALAQTYGWWERLGTPAVLTPHPGEMSRLLRITVADIQQDRLATVQRAAQMWGQVVVLKGAYTVVAAPDGRACISPLANPAMASAGTGDVLAGVIGALLAQGQTPYAAAVAGVHLHSAAGERVRADLGDAGLMASDLLPLLPQVMKDLRSGK